MGKRFFAIIAVILFVVLLIAGIGGYVYYQSLKSTPQYSLALLVDAAKRDDKPAVDEFVDFNAVVEDFLPQITDKAVELYGRGVPQPVLARVTKLATPMLPAVRERARAELPRVIRDRTERFGDIPFFAMVFAADRYLDVTISGETAFVKSKLPEHKFEVRMRRKGDRWQIVGVKDEQVATDIARKIGQQIIAIASKGFSDDTAEKLGIGNLADLMRQAEELVK